MSDDEPTTVDEAAEQISEALNLEDGDGVCIVTPQFERADGVEPGEPPLTFEAMNRLRQADKSELEELGLRKWSDETGLWLLPHEWYPHIPDEYPLLSIMDRTETRAEMPANPDKRFGVLSVGIVPDFERGEPVERSLEVADVE